MIKVTNLIAIGIALLGSLGWVKNVEAAADALIYDGVATAYGDVEAIQKILTKQKMTSDLADSNQMNQLTLDQFSQYRLIIWPGGYAGQMSNSLFPATRVLIRRAVKERGVSYVGICAGAFIAVGSPVNGLAIIGGNSLSYYHLENEGVDDAMVNVAFSSDLVKGGSRSLVWWGGPKFPEYTKGVIARYEDTHEAAIIQTQAGSGMVILSGPHPEAPISWRTKLGLSDPDGLDQDIAGKIFDAAFKRVALPTLN